MKFVCLECDSVMEFAERDLPGDGTFGAVFTCGSCGREIAMLANPMETQLVSSMGVRIGGRELPEQPMELTRTRLSGERADAFEAPAAEAGPAAPEVAETAGEPRREVTRNEGGDAPAPTPGGTTPSGGAPEWTPEAKDRLGKVPRFVRGMVKRIYTDYARERGIGSITPEIMDRARIELGLEGM